MKKRGENMKVILSLIEQAFKPVYSGIAYQQEVTAISGHVIRAYKIGKDQVRIDILEPTRPKVAKGGGCRE
jgi:hypothetical protein